MERITGKSLARRRNDRAAINHVGELASLDKIMTERMSASVPTEAQVGILLAMTVVTGIVDAVRYLALGRVVTANMIGNIGLLGFEFTGGFEALHSALRCGVSRILVRGRSRGSNGLSGFQLASLGRPGVHVGGARS
jgi:hypothetical protein